MSNSDITEFEVEPKTVIHINDANDNPMFAKDAEGKPDPNKPMRISVWGPGSKQYAKAQAAQNNAFVDRLKKKGKSDQTAEQKLKEQTDFLVGVTEYFENITVGELQGEALFRAVYSNIKLGFVAEQVGKAAGDWSGFSKPSMTT